MSGALSLAAPETEAFAENAQDLAAYNFVPCGCDVVPLGGLVAIFDRDTLRREEITEGAYYVRERQRPRASMPWSNWLALETQDATPRSGPASPLQIEREVVRAIRWRCGDQWALQSAEGYTDGPFYDWAFGHDFIGKVIGLYQPRRER